MNRLEEIKDRRSKISNDGNWFIMHGEDLCGHIIDDEPDSLGWVKGGLDDVGQNAQFVSNAPSDIEYLLNEVERYKAALEQIKFDYEQSQDHDIAMKNMYREAKAALEGQ